ncbi:sigma factor-like helix-turn-helix DNA-binding protein [Corynebacterium rouxii]|uniref:Sigma factor-like helix-turn-helix DNA-binding protein n=1 Tax=Corynebacterium rouxii TaxID=2719119 RepID=A0ABU3PKQ3_9CORY|nr:sigma factor-like helix-turn-helix DNA-binding protein [Corynebacterium rouxii]MDT9408158.1 sigma factor-like helix-turn-helix DNA-binding protein [Corynebacterium rouxii]MDT9410337.1 sigma factor-like helix-turn-helix DNA-binding protein [Corynebacterium rouxii]
MVWFIAALAIAKKKGKLRGKQPKLSARQQQHVRQMYASREYTQADIAELMNVSDWTVRRILKASPAWHQFRDSHTWLCDRDTHQKLLCMLWLRFALRRTCCSLRYWGLGHVYRHWGSTRVAGILMILRVANLRR